jgi:hypothetical protein
MKSINVDIYRLQQTSVGSLMKQPMNRHELWKTEVKSNVLLKNFMPVQVKCTAKLITQYRNVQNATTNDQRLPTSFIINSSFLAIWEDVVDLTQSLKLFRGQIQLTLIYSVRMYLQWKLIVCLANCNNTHNINFLYVTSTAYTTVLIIAHVFLWSVNICKKHITVCFIKVQQASLKHLFKGKKSLHRSNEQKYTIANLPQHHTSWTNS